MYRTTFYASLRRGSPKGVVPPECTAEERAHLLADLLVHEQGVDTMLAGDHVRFNRQFYGYMGNFYCYDMEVLSAVCGLTEMVLTGCRADVAAALEERPGSVEALVSWTFRTPWIEHDDDNGSPHPGSDLDDDDPRYNAAPQTHPKYAELMCLGPLPVLRVILNHPRLLQRVKASPDYAGLVERVEELSKRTDRAFARAAEIARAIHEVLNGSPDAVSGAEGASGAASGSGRRTAMQVLLSDGCTLCGEFVGPEGEKLRKCSACRGVQYCSVACQKQDWGRHKPECRQLRQAQG